MGSHRIRVMVVEEDATEREWLTNSLDSHRLIDVIATPHNVELANNLLRRSGKDTVRADVIALGHTKTNKKNFTELLTLAPKARILVVSNTPHLAAKDVSPKLAEAIEYLPAPLKHNEKERETYLNILTDRVSALGSVTKATEASPTLSETRRKKTSKQEEHSFSLRNFPPSFLPRALAIASSTGGPQALNKVFAALKGKHFAVPIFITQHMPVEFIPSFAEQLGNTCGIPAKPAADKEAVHPGTIYVAPGNHHMCITQKNDRATIALNQDPPVNFCRPAADPMLESIATVYGAQSLVLVMTGMGSDGFRGAEKVANAGGCVIAQDEESSVVWGMPGAVALGGLCSAVYPLSDIPEALINLFVGKIQ